MAEQKESAEAAVRTIRRFTQNRFSEEIWILLEGLRGELAERVAGSVRLTSRWLARPTSRSSSVHCREGHQDSRAARFTAEGVVASVHIRKIEGRSPSEIP